MVHRLVHVTHQQEVLRVDDLVHVDGRVDKDEAGHVLVLELPDVDFLPDGVHKEAADVGDGETWGRGLGWGVTQNTHCMGESSD